MKKRDVERIVKLEAEIERLQGKINDAKRKIALIRNQNCEPTDHLDCTGRLIYTNDTVRYEHKDCLGHVTSKTGKVFRNIHSTNVGSAYQWYIQAQNGTKAWLGLCLNRELEILS